MLAAIGNVVPSHLYGRPAESAGPAERNERDEPPLIARETLARRTAP
jgi:hypothetical protein